jgi:hypothetical protein
VFYATGFAGLRGYFSPFPDERAKPPSVLRPEAGFGPDDFTKLQKKWRCILAGEEVASKDHMLRFRRSRITIHHFHPESDE